MSRIRTRYAHKGQPSRENLPNMKTMQYKWPNPHVINTKKTRPIADDKRSHVSRQIKLV